MEKKSYRKVNQVVNDMGRKWDSSPEYRYTNDMQKFIFWI